MLDWVFQNFVSNILFILLYAIYSYWAIVFHNYTKSSLCYTELTSSMFYICYYATTAVHNETSCDAQAHNIYNTL